LVMGLVLRQDIHFLIACIHISAEANWVAIK
jgi:hypothetical protein